ncbi:probable 2-oxoglutarate-dependent dioxygenase At3g49630 [Acidimicrobiaceae bacterium]|nr:probable 2-oxoglutarate-dependent dioxygenase At3g49630 [Acidimicrobiaceae bacterium]
MNASLPLIDVGPLLSADSSESAANKCAHEIDSACRQSGFFRITNHGVSRELRERLDELSREFFALNNAEKSKCAMPLAGSAWRGWFGVGDELTSGVPDRKEGLYIGEQLPASDPRVVARTPLHGANLYPQIPAELGACADEWFAAMQHLGAALMRGVALGLQMPADWFAKTIASQPTCLFRIFHYPPVDILRVPQDGISEWGVAEHTDYGLLTILAQDDCGGLQVRMTTNSWLDVPAEPDIFVVNIGDMLDRLTLGRYRSTAHRVKNSSGRERMSYPFFIDPSWDASVEPLPLDGTPPADDVARRWDNTSVQAWTGTYGEYLTAKVSKVFPALFATLK